MEHFTKNPIPEVTSVRLYDPSSYEFLPGASLSRRDIFDAFVDGFPEFLRREAATEENVRAQEAKKLLDALEQCSDRHLADTISLSSSCDWTDTTEISDVATLFDVLEGLNGVLNDPPLSNKRAAEAFRHDPDNPDDITSPLATYTRWLFQDKTLTNRHGYLWEQFVSEALATKYVKERKEKTPEIVERSWEYASDLLEKGFGRAENGEDDRSVGVEQLVGTMIEDLHILEAGDPRYDYRRRQEIAHEISGDMARGDTEGVLATLLKYIKPKGIDPESIQGALFKIATIKNANGETLFAEWQSADSFWFKPPFDKPQPDEQISFFPNSPQIIRSYDHTGQSSDARAILYKDPSYFRPDGTKVYWGDLSKEDMKIIQGNYYCVSQSESYYEAPEWAIIMASPLDNDDPNRPVESYINTEEGRAFQRDNPVFLHPDYIRAVAIGAIMDGQFIPNQRRAKLEFIPNDQSEPMTDSY